MTNRELLAQVDLFSELQNHELDILLEHAITKSYRKNVILLNEGDHSGSLYLILSGTVKAYASDEEGNELLLNMFSKGEYFGEFSLIDEQPRSASVMTLEPCKLLMIDRNAFTECLRKNSAMTINLLKAMTQKLREQTEKTKALALFTVYERLIKLLQDLAVEHDGHQIVEGISHQDLADQIFSSREMVSVILKELKQGGYIDVERKKIIIKKRLPAKW